MRCVFHRRAKVLILKYVSKYLILLLLLFTAYSHGQEAPKPTQKISTVDKLHGKLSTGVVRLSNKIDGFFGSKRAEDLANGTQVKLTYLAHKTEGEDLEHEGLIKFRLKLPYLEKLLKISFKSKAKEEEVKTETTSGKRVEISAPAKIAKAIIEEPKKWSFHFNTGIKVEIPPQFFANLRLRRSAYFGKWEFRTSQEFFWYSRDGFGETTTVDFDRPISGDLLFRIRNLATWTDETDKFLTDHGPILYWQISDRRAMSFHTTTQGTSKPTFQIISYQGGINYRQLLHQKWFYMETGPTIDFARSNNWESVLSYNIKFEVLIGSY